MMANSKLVIKLKTDSGSSSTDWITKSGAMNISGALAGDKLFYQIVKAGDVASATGWVATSGAVPAASVDGTWTVWVKEVSAAGAVVQTISQTYTLDRSAAAPSVALLNDNGVSSTDGISNSGVLAVGAEPGAKVQYSIDNGKTWSTSFTAKVGVNNVLVKQTDLAGNVSPTKSYSFTLDTTAPTTAPSVSLQVDSSDGVAGHNSDLISNNSALNISGLEANARVLYSVDGTNWSSAFTPKEGLNTVQVLQQDVAGNNSPITTFSFTLDTQVAAPSIALKVDSTDGAAGHNADLVSNNAELLVANIETGANVQYSSNGTVWGASFAAQEGVNNVLVRQVDVAGNVSSSANLTFTLDTQAPIANNDTGASYTNTALIINALANDSGGFTLKGVDAVSAHGGVVSLNADGSFSYVSAANFVGADSFNYQIIDAAGNVAQALVSVDVSAPNPNGNQAPVVYDNTIAATPFNSTTPLVINALDYAYDPEGVPLSVVLPATLPTGLTFDAVSNTFSFDQSTYKAGDKLVFNYAVSDGALSTPASATIYVTEQLPFTAVDAQNTSALGQALLGANSGIEIDLGSIAFHASGASSTQFYDGSLAALGIGSGLLLTSGTTPGLVNTVAWFGTDNSYDPVTGVSNFDNGDADLNAVVNTVFQTTSYDATTLAFDFNATENTATSLSFNLVFGSDEYPEWVDQFVDTAIVMVNGQNVALFNHNVMSPLSVIGSNLSAGYFQDNADSHLPIEYDGVSKVLTIVAPIHAGTNSIKIGIGDTGDHIYDSGIFIANLKAGNLSGSGVLIEDNSSTSGNDTLSGSGASDLVNLGGGNDSITAGAGDDIVDGGSGNDAITGGSGADVLTGGAGADDFDYTNKDDWAAYGSGTDTITDFAANSQVLLNVANLDNINADVLVFNYSDLATLAGAGWAVELKPAAGGFSTLSDTYLSHNTDGSADQDHAQFVYDASTGAVGFDWDGIGSQNALEITLLDNHASLLSTAFVVMG